MKSIIENIFPVFAVIFLGWFLRRRGFVDDSFTASANRLVFYVGVPALIFREIARADFSSHFNAPAILLTLLAVLLAFAVAWLVSSGMEAGARGTFLQAAVHGNTSYIGLAMVFYSLGDRGLQRAGVLSGFLILLNNTLAVLSLVRWGRTHRLSAEGVRAALLNPIVIASMTGLACSFLGLDLPVPVDRSLNIVGNMSLPMALLVIGAGLSFGELHRHLGRVVAATAIKIVGLPLAGLVSLRLAGVPADFATPALLILAAPTATLTYVMAREMGGDEELAGAAIGVSTLASAVGYAFWFMYV
jgi:predicted permease